MGPTPLDGSRGPSAHFTWEEAAARPDPAKAAETLRYLQAHANLWPAAVRLAENCEVLRALVGKPVRVTCGLRPPPIEGALTSQHQAGQAWDFQVDGLTPRALLKVIRTADEQGAFPHPFRQVIAESNAGSASDLDLPMRAQSGRWVHGAVLGVDGEPWGHPSQSGKWLLSWDLPGPDRAYRVAP